MKIMLMGYGRHGKDTVADILKVHYNLKIASSSWIVAEKAVFPTLSLKYGYKTVLECYDDRHNGHRQEWFDLINAYNTPDLTRMSREIFKDNDVYVGIRNAKEFLAAKEQKVFDTSIWVDAMKRVGVAEPDTSCTVKPEMADHILDNNGNISNLTYAIIKLMKSI